MPLVRTPFTIDFADRPAFITPEPTYGDFAPAPDPAPTIRDIPSPLTSPLGKIDYSLGGGYSPASYGVPQLHYLTASLDRGFAEFQAQAAAASAAYRAAQSQPAPVAAEPVSAAASPPKDEEPVSLFYGQPLGGPLTGPVGFNTPMPLAQPEDSSVDLTSVASDLLRQYGENWIASEFQAPLPQSSGFTIPAPSGVSNAGNVVSTGLELANKLIPTRPGMPQIPRDARTGQVIKGVMWDPVAGKWVKRRRRRRKLLTDSDFNALLKIQTLKNTDNVKIAIAKALGR